MANLLVQSLDLKQVEITLLIKLCDELRMDESLILVCSEIRDYITPIMKIISRPDSANRSGGKKVILTYLRSTFLMQKINGEKIQDRGEFSEMMRNIVQFLFVPENLESFLQIDLIESYSIMYMLFNSLPFSTIVNLNSQIRISVPKDYPEKIEMIFQSIF